MSIAQPFFTTQLLEFQAVAAQDRQSIEGMGSQRRQSSSIQTRKNDTGAYGQRSADAAILPIDASLTKSLQRRVSQLVRIEAPKEKSLQDLTLQDTAARVTEAFELSKTSRQEVHWAAVSNRVDEAAEGVQSMRCEPGSRPSAGKVNIADIQPQTALAPGEKVDIIMHQNGVMVQQLKVLSDAMDSLKAFQLPAAIQQVLDAISSKVLCCGRLLDLASSNLADLEGLSQLLGSHSDVLGQLLEHIHSMQKCLHEQASKLDPATRSNLRWLPAVEHCLVSLGILSNAATAVKHQIDVEASHESLACPKKTSQDGEGFAASIVTSLTAPNSMSTLHNLRGSPPECSAFNDGTTLNQHEVVCCGTECEPEKKADDRLMYANPKREETSQLSSDCPSTVMCCSDAPPPQQQAEKELATEAVQDTEDRAVRDASMSTSLFSVAKRCRVAHEDDLVEELDVSEKSTSASEMPITPASAGIAPAAAQEESPSSGTSAGSQSAADGPCSQLAEICAPIEPGSRFASHDGGSPKLAGSRFASHGGGSPKSRMYSRLLDCNKRQSKEIVCNKSTSEYCKRQSKEVVCKKSTSEDGAPQIVFSAAADMGKDSHEKTRDAESSSHWPFLVRPSMPSASETFVMKARSDPLKRPPGLRPKYCRPTASYTLENYTMETLSPMQEKLRAAIVEEDSSPVELMELFLSESYAAEHLPHLPDGNFKRFKQKPSKTGACPPTQRGISLPVIAGRRRFGGCTT